MGNPKQKWTAEEEEALIAGVAKYGAGKWKNIQMDPEFNRFLFARSNIDLKDKWRNMSAGANGQGSRDKSRSSKSKAIVLASAEPSSTPPPSAPAKRITHDALADLAIDDSSKSTAPKYNALIIEAISALKEPNGSDFTGIVNYIERRHEVPQNFRRLLSSRLRRLVGQEKIEKIGNCYKIKKDAMSGTKPPIPKPKDIRGRQLQNSSQIPLTEVIEDAAVAAAYQVAEAENKSFVAAESVKEAERVAKMAEDADSMLQLAQEIFEKCARGENILLA